jgi:predicted Zn-dependent protease with MMP-like domain
MNKRDFEKLIVKAARKLPKSIRDKIENVVFVLEERESPGRNLFGLYHGIPKTARGRGYSAVLPDKIIFYKKTIERFAGDEGGVKRLIQKVVWHEIGHHLGFSESEIRRLERKWDRDRKFK